MIDLDDARKKVAEYIHHYNQSRLHSGIGFITPSDMINGKAERIFKERDQKLQQARQKRRVNNKLKKAA